MSSDGKLSLGTVSVLLAIIVFVIALGASPLSACFSSPRLFRLADQNPDPREIQDFRVSTSILVALPQFGT